MVIETPFPEDAVRFPSGATVRALESYFITPNTEFFNMVLEDGQSTVAKRLPIAFRDDVSQRNQFARECQFLNSLEHKAIAAPHLVPLSENELIQVLPTDNYFTVRQLGETCRRLERRLPLGIAAFVIYTVAKVVSHVEERTGQGNQAELNIVLHPDTLVIDSAGRITVTNICLASPPYLTSSILGASHKRYFVYAAPEQCVAGSPPDRRSCYYTFGMLCYELLTSQPLFSPSTTKDLEKVSRRKIRRLHPLLSDVDPALECLDNFVFRLLEPIPRNRETDPDAILGVLGAIPETRPANEEDLASYVNELNQAQSDAIQQESAAVPGQLSATTDINEYNAS